MAGPRQTRPDRRDRRRRALRAGGCASRSSRTSAERVRHERRSRTQRLAIKEGDLFLYTDALGHVPGAERLGARPLLPRHALPEPPRDDARRPPPVLLSSTAERGYAGRHGAHQPRGCACRTDAALPQASIHVRRTPLRGRPPVRAACACATSATRAVELALDLHFDADFADLFEVRGLRRRDRGTSLAPKPEGRTLTLAYLGLRRGAAQDGHHLRGSAGERAGRVACASTCALAPRERRLICATTSRSWRRARPSRRAGDFNARLGGSAPRPRALGGRVPPTSSPTTSSSAPCCGARRTTCACWPRRPSYGDAAAGRHAVVRGALRPRHDPRRPGDADARPRLARGGRARSYAPAGQGRQRLSRGAAGQDHARDAPRRAGQPASASRIRRTSAPIDTTPLYLLLLCEARHVERRPRVLRAAARADRRRRWPGSTSSGDLDGDGFVEYRRRSRVGLRQPGLARRRRRGACTPTAAPAEGPIALAEVQGYVYHAKRRLARSTASSATSSAPSACRPRRRSSSGASTSASGWRTSSSSPWRWTATSARCKTVSSTAGHCLWSRIVDDEYVPAVVHRLHGAGHVHRLGRAHHEQGGAGLQPGELLQRQRVAARQRHHRRRHQEARLRAGGQPHRRRPLRGGAGSRDLRLPELFCGFTRQSIDTPGLVPHGLLAGRLRRRRPCSSCCSRCSASTRPPRRTSCTCTTRAAQVAGRGDADQPARGPHRP